MTLSLRLNLFVALLLVLLVIAGGAAAVLNARTAVAREIESTVNLTLALLTAASAAADATGSAAMRAALSDRLGRLQEIRHLDIAMLGADGLPLLPLREHDAPSAPDAPAWFVQLVRPTTVEYRHRVGAPGAPYSEVAIRPNPADEISEAWAQSRAEVLLLLSFAALAMLVISWTVKRALQPVTHILRALEVLQGGDYSARLPEPRLPELRRIAQKLNGVAEQLGRHELENRALRKRALSIQESERRTLAQELHDELGQSISAIKALAASLARSAGADEQRERARTIASICDDLYGTVRGMMKRLRPVVLDELGLGTALRRAAEEWTEHHAGAVCELDVEGDLEGIGEDVAIGVYRIVQEALTNVARHARATRVRVAVRAPRPDDASLRVRVDDDGIGFDPAAVRGGFGLLGMRERVLALGGDLRIESAAGRGTTLRASIPVADAAPSA
jgi:two-component system sensor histidine kinase UhpB